MTSLGDMALVDAALTFARWGWPVLPVAARGKKPLSSRGVLDASTDPATIGEWFTRWPAANLGVACGAPGPTVLDIDRPEEAGDVLPRLAAIGAPTVVTSRGQHLYFAGLDQGTVGLDYGELRSRGSYVVVPPSIHPSGHVYTFLIEPNGTLPEVPSYVVAGRSTAGVGVAEAVELVSYGARHNWLVDRAVRLVRGGILDTAEVEAHLRTAYETKCETDPPAAPNEFAKIASWAIKSEIAGRERVADLADRATERAKARSSAGSAMRPAPDADATLAEHRDYVADAGGWLGIAAIADVRRYGPNAADALDVTLDNGWRLAFDRHTDVTARGRWADTVTIATSGMAEPRTGLKGWELAKVLRSLLVLANTPAEEHERDAHQMLVDEFLALTELVGGHTLRDSPSRFALIEALRARATWSPRNPETILLPARIVDELDRREYVRAGELTEWLHHRKVGVSSRQIRGRMSMLGLEWIEVSGREAASVEQRKRRKIHAALYLLPHAGPNDEDDEQVLP